MMYAIRTAAFSALPVVFLACASSTPPPRTPIPSGATNAQPSSAPQPPVASEPAAATDGAITLRISDEIRVACGIDDHDAFFGFDSHALRSEDMPVLDRLATCFSAGPLSGRTMKLVGHADPRGQAEYNIALGQARADAVAGYIERHGLDKGHVESSSRGALDATGTDEATWQKDRRVDVLLGS